MSFPSTPPANELLSKLEQVPLGQHAVNGYFKPLAERLGGREDVSPREIVEAIVETREAYLESLPPVLRAQVKMVEADIVDAVTTPETQPFVNTGLMLDSFDRATPEVQQAVLDAASRGANKGPSRGGIGF